MASSASSRGRKRRRGKEEGGSSSNRGDHGVHELQQGGVRRQRGLAQEPVRFLLSFSLFESRLCMDELGLQHYRTPLSCTIYSMAPLVRINYHPCQ
jgi:hypothetical protein